MTEAEPLQQLRRTYVRFRNRTLSYFAGCDYFRLSSHPRVIAALEEGLKRYGLNVAASRLTTGNHALYPKLEKSLASFFGAEDALLVSAGYLANLVAGQALSGNFSHALVDEKSHPSILDAVQMLDCPVVRFKHRDPDDVARSVHRCGPGAKLLLATDGMFSHDGSAAPLAAYLKVLPSDALLLVDDAHAGGLLGDTGKGSLEHAGVNRRRIIQTVTLSKAFGTHGGAIISTRAFRQKIIQHSKLFASHTPLPLPIANAALCSIEILKSDKSLRRRLFSNSSYVKQSLVGTRSTASPTSNPGPIIPIIPRSAADVAAIRRALLAAKIFPSFIKYPGGPADGYYRFVISSEHTRSQLAQLTAVLDRVMPP